MTFLGSIAVGVMCAITGAVCGGYLAYCCTEWFDVTTPYASDLLTLLAGAALGLVVGAVFGVAVPLAAGGGFLKKSGIALAAELGLALLIYSALRVNGDVPPLLDGRRMNLEVEILAPVGWNAESLGSRREWNWITLSSIDEMYRQRSSRRGRLSLERARSEDGRMVIPGAVQLFTSRGDRGLTYTLGGDPQPDGFIVPLPGVPGPEFERWSDWLPRRGRAEDVRYRFRVVRDTEQR